MTFLVAGLGKRRHWYCFGRHVWRRFRKINQTTLNQLGTPVEQHRSHQVKQWKVQTPWDCYHQSGRLVDRFSQLEEWDLLREFTSARNINWHAWTRCFQARFDNQFHVLQHQWKQSGGFHKDGNLRPQRWNHKNSPRPVADLSRRPP